MNKSQYLLTTSSFKLLFLCLSLLALSSTGLYASELKEGDLFVVEDESNSGDTGFYIAAGIARASADFKGDALDKFDIDFDDSENAFSARAGIMLTNWIGIEGGYYNFDNFSDIANDTFEDLNIPGANADLELDAWTGALVLNIPIYFIDLYARGGVAHLDGKASATILGNTISTSESRTEPFAVVGGEIDFGVINLYTEYTRVIDTDDVEIDLITGGIKLEF